jgi:ElaB/YqjD/DUF883 family membrane-anchored ribosome-binding protein
MRFLLRLAVLALAAFGAKALYDRYAPKAAELKEPMAGVLDNAKEAARDVSGHARDAAAQVVDDAKQRAGDVKDQAHEAVATAADDAPTIAAAN